MTYKEFSETLNKRVEKKRRKDKLISYLLFEVSWMIMPFVCMVLGMICLQAMWGQYAFTKVLWILTAVVGAFTAWGVVGDVRAEMEEEE